VDALLDSSEDKHLVSQAGFGIEYSINKIFLNIDILGGGIHRLQSTKGDNDYKNTNLSKLRLTAGYKVLPHLGIFGGVSYDFFSRWEDTSPDPRDFNGPFLGGAFDGDRYIHKLGFFGGVQF
jgi:hypothetical protein